MRIQSKLEFITQAKYADEVNNSIQTESLPGSLTDVNSFERNFSRK